MSIGKYDIVKLLLKHGADAGKKNRDGHTPLDLVRDGDQDIADLLRGDAALLDAAKKGHLARVHKLVTSSNNKKIMAISEFDSTQERDEWHKKLKDQALVDPNTGSDNLAQDFH